MQQEVVMWVTASERAYDAHAAKMVSVMDINQMDSFMRRCYEDRRVNGQDVCLVAAMRDYSLADYPETLLTVGEWN